MEDKLELLKKYVSENQKADAAASSDSTPEGVNSQTCSPHESLSESDIPSTQTESMPKVDHFESKDTKTESRRRAFSFLRRRKGKKDKLVSKITSAKTDAIPETLDESDPADVSQYTPMIKEMLELLEPLKANVDCLRRKSFARIDPFQKQNRAVLDTLVQDTQVKAQSFNTKFIDIGNLASKDTELRRRIVADQLTAASKQFEIILRDFTTAQEESERMIGKHLRYQLEIVNPEAPVVDDTELTGLQGQMFLTQMDPETIGLLQIREEGMKEIEKGIRELRELMVELALLMSQQGEMVDSIEKRLESTSAWVGEAKINLKKARRLRARERRKKFLLFTIILGGVASLGAFFGLKIASGGL